MSTVDIPLEGTPVDLPVIDEAGEIDVEALRNDNPQFWTVADSAALDQEWAAYVNELQADYPPQVSAAFEAAMSPIKLAIDDGTITPPQGEAFLRWLNYNKGVTSVTFDATTTSTMTSYLSAWIIEQSKLVAPPTTPAPVPAPGPVTTPVPTPAPVPPPAPVTAPVVITPVEPAPSLAPNPPAPAPLPTPSQGQVTTSTAMATVTSSTVTGGTDEGTSAAQVSAALAVTAVGILEVVAKVFDAFLPHMAPGQVPEALGQLNQAVHVLEDQLAVLRATTTGHAVGSLSGQITALQAALALVQTNITDLTDQLAEKADSGLEDDLAGTKSQVSELAGTVGTLSAVTVPALAGGLATLTSTVGALDSEVQDKLAPQLNATTEATAANTAMLSGTDQDCLDQLCDAEGNVINPIKEGGATPSLLKQLGGLLAGAAGLGLVVSFLDSIFDVAQAKAAVQGVVADAETLGKWATSAAGAIESELSSIQTTVHG
jgi:hypothetical protein